MYKGKIIARLIDKNTGSLKYEKEIVNQVVDDIRLMMFTAAYDLEPICVHIGYDDDDSVAPNNPKCHWGNLAGKMLADIQIDDPPINMGNENYEYRCVYPTNAFSPPSSGERQINLIALKRYWDNILYAYKKLTVPIVQTTNDYLEIIYTLSSVVVA